MRPSKLVSRRSVLALAGLGAVGASLPLGGWRRLFSTTPPDPVRDLTLAAFTPYIGSAFDVEVTSRQRAQVRLVKAQQIGPFAGDAHGLRGEAFSLVLGGTHKQIAEGTHNLVHPELGRLKLFMSPVGAGESGDRYQIVVDHRRLAG